jgi:multidrug efflux pump
MSLSTPFIHRPVATTLLTIAVALAGGLAYFFLPVSPLPQVDYPSVSVSASLPGASPETMASSVATPLERQFGRIAGVTEMTSSSTLGTTNITLLFDLNRDLNAAARDVQAAINAAAGNLPANLPSKPTYRKINPADAPIMILTMTSDVYGKPAMYDKASSILAQSLAQVQGVGQVNVGGSALPGVRVEVNPTLLNNFGLGLQDVKTVLAAANANQPKGQIDGKERTLTVNTSDQLFKADQYRSLLITYRNGAPVRVGDVAEVVDSVEDIRQVGLACTATVDSSGKRVADIKNAVLLVIFRQPGANIIDTVDEIKRRLPMLQASIPPGMKLGIGLDRTLTIRASVQDVKFTLLISIALVVLVVFVFLRDIRATLIPSVAVPVSLIGTFGIMYLFNYSLDNLSLMALCIATGFVVDDAIVVVENISRHIEEGLEPLQAALKGAKEIGFTVLSISVSLVAVFIPILMMGGYIGRLFREFAVTLSVAIFVSMIVSLTTTPMMAAVLLKSKKDHKPGRLYRASEAVFDGILWLYESGLRWVLRHQPLMLLLTIGTIALTVYLYFVIPKGLFPQQDTGRISGFLKADQDTSFQAMEKLLKQFASVVAADPNVDTTLAFSGGRGAFNQAQMFATLKPNGLRKETVDEVLADLRRKTARIPGATLIFQPVQDFRIGGRQSSSQYQFTLQGDDLKELNTWAPKLKNKLATLTSEGIVDVDSDQQNGGLQADLTYDRATAARMGISSQQLDATLYDAFGQEQVSTMYAQLNQYHVVMEVNQSFWQSPDSLKYIYVEGTNSAQVPLTAVTHAVNDTTPLAVNHSGVFPSITISFNLAPRVSLGDAVIAIQNAERDIGMPASIHGNFSGAAQAYQDSLGNMLLLIVAALVTVYIVLGILYESLIHPITILSTLPSAGVGALLALLATHTDLTVIADIGIILLIGIVKKNAIMMIDFALEAERTQGKSPEEAIFQACSLRFRPITMTTMAALLGGLPLAIGGGTGSELRTPLGISIVGGLIFSQMLTLFTTPVIYLYLDRLRLWLSGKERETRPIWAEGGLETAAMTSA